MILLTSEVAFPLDCAIVLAFGLIQYDAHPFPWGKESGANIGNSTPLTLSYDLHYRADLGEKKRWETVSHYTLVDINLFFFSFLVSGLEKVTHLWRFTTLHCSRTAHFADQWAGQLEDLGEMGRKMRKWGKEKEEDGWLPVGKMPLHTREFIVYISELLMLFIS